MLLTFKQTLYGSCAKHQEIIQHLMKMNYFLSLNRMIKTHFTVNL